MQTSQFNEQSTNHDIPVTINERTAIDLRDMEHPVLVNAPSKAQLDAGAPIGVKAHIDAAATKDFLSISLKKAVALLERNKISDAIQHLKDISKEADQMFPRFKQTELNFSA